MLGQMEQLRTHKYTTSVSWKKSSRTRPFPDPEPLPGDDRNMPYFFVADNAFQLRTDTPARARYIKKQVNILDIDLDNTK